MELRHYGTKRHSGRYPWGSGEDPFQSTESFLGGIKELQKKGLSEAQIAEAFGISTTQLRAKKSIAKAEKKKADIAMAVKLKDKGYSNTAIGERMGINESSVRELLKPTAKENADMNQNIASSLKKAIAEKRYIDIGEGVENQLGVSDTRLKTAVEMLKEEGYTVHYLRVPQLGTNELTTVKVLAPPDTPYQEVYKNKDKVQPPGFYTEDNGRTVLGIKPPQSVSSDRIEVAYNSDKDGVIELRRGPEDISLGGSRYAQVRIAVDGTHYLKGMAVYSDDLPKGVDIRFNTGKDKKERKLDAFKEMKDDPDNPFSSTVRQHEYIGKDGKKHLSAINIVNEEGSWSEWSKNLSSQMLSKQTPALAKKQLSLAYKIKEDELAEILSLTNPVVRKKLLTSLADDCDSSASHLKAAALPRQRTQVILPLRSISDNEIYAPNFNNGERVALVRYPHGGIFEIPELRVNNRNKEGAKLLGAAKDAVGINPKVASRLSGADFDGDTVLVIPNNHGHIKSAPPLRGLKGFDPQRAYKGYSGMKVMSESEKQTQMGKVSNLITDMTLKGATSSEIARAVRHSMVVIDAVKHKLDVKQSAIDNGISALKKKYQGKSTAGASTLISRSNAERRIEEIKPRKARDGGPIDPVTGKKIFYRTGATYVNKNGETVKKKTTVRGMDLVDDAHNLSSGTPMESLYADHANRLKALANKARKEAIATKPKLYSPSARKAYSKEVSTLRASLNIALKAKPLERRAQIIANSIVDAKKKANPDLDKDDLKKIKQQALNEARHRVFPNGHRPRIKISPSEWAAIQAGAISTSMLTRVIDSADLDDVKALATPRSKVELHGAKKQRAKSMISSGYTQAEVAEALGISVSTVNRVLDDKD